MASKCLCLITMDRLQSAAAKVHSLLELLESMLETLPEADLVVVQRVNRCFRIAL